MDDKNEMDKGALRQPLVSVIVPIYQMEKYLRQCLDSIIQQTYDNLEILLVNDGSTDGSEAICEEYLSRDPRIKLITQENKGLSGARNAGLDVVSGTYIGFVDADDYIDEGMYDYLMSLALEKGTKIATCGYHLIVDGKMCREQENEQVDVYTAEEALLRLVRRDGLDNMVCMHLFHRDLFEEIRFPQGHVYEDIFTFYRLLVKTERIAVSNRAMYNYVVRMDSISKVNSEKHLWDRYTAYKTRLDAIEKKYPRIAGTAASAMAWSCIDIYNMLCLLRGDEIQEKKEEVKQFFLDQRNSIPVSKRCLFAIVKAAEILRLNRCLFWLYSSVKKWALTKSVTAC